MVAMLTACISQTSIQKEAAMKVNYRRLAAGRETARHYESGYKSSSSKNDRRKDDQRRDHREMRDEIYAR
jgi:hypothetical protein